MLSGNYNPYLINDKNNEYVASPPLLQKNYFSIISGKWVDIIFAYCAAYGRGKLHFKTGGWGDLDTAERCCDELKSQSYVQSEISVEERVIAAGNWVDGLMWETDWIEDQKGAWYRDGSFPTPLIRMFGKEATNKMLFEPAQRCYFRYVVPSINNPSTKASAFGLTATEPTLSLEKHIEHNGSKQDLILCKNTAKTLSSNIDNNSSLSDCSGNMPLCIHLPCAGDQFFDWRNRHFATPLAVQHGIASLIIEAPTYGKRRRKNRQVRGAQVHRISDLAVGGLTQIVESIGLFAWMKNNVPCHSMGNFGMCGISMGAEITTLYAAVTPIPTHIVAVMPPHSATATWNVGVLNECSDWDHLASAMNGTKIATATDARNRVQEWLQQTDIRTFPKPYHWMSPKDRPNILILGALHDAYIPAESTWKLAKHWNEMANCRWLPGGHCTTVVFHKNTILGAIAEVFNSRLMKEVIDR